MGEGPRAQESATMSLETVFPMPLKFIIKALKIDLKSIPMDSHRWKIDSHGFPSMENRFPWIPIDEKPIPTDLHAILMDSHRWIIDCHRWEKPWKIDGDPWDLNPGVLIVNNRFLQNSFLSVNLSLQPCKEHLSDRLSFCKMAAAETMKRF